MKGGGGIYRRGRYWWIHYQLHGQPRRFESAGTEVYEEAVAMLQKRMVDAREKRHPAAPAMFEDLRQLLLDDYGLSGRRSSDRAKSAFKRLATEFKEAKASTIDGARLMGYANARKAAGASSATIKYELALLKRGFHLAHRVGKVAAIPPFPSITVSNARAGFFEDHQFRAVLAHLPADLQPLALFYYWTGWRKRELLMLQWRHVSLEAGEIRLDVGTTKTGRGRLFPFRAVPELASALNAQRARTTALEQAGEVIIPWVFHRGGRQILDFRTAWRKACAAAGCPGRIPHDFRRTAARNLVRLGMPEKLVMAVTGHATRSVFDRYHIVSDSDIAEALEKAARKA